MENNTLSRSIKRALYGGTAAVAVGLAFPVGAQCPTSAAGINGQTVSESINSLTCTDLGYSFGCDVDGGEGGSCFVDDSEFFEVFLGEGDFSWEATSAERPVEVVYALDDGYEGYGGVSCAYSYTGGATHDEGLDSGYGGVDRILACANENTPPDVPVCEFSPTVPQCDAAGGAAYIIGYSTGEFGEPVICPCPGTDEPNIEVRDCNVGQGQPNNCFVDDSGGPSIGRDEVSQSVSIVEGSNCAIHCFPIDGKRICQEICPPE